MNQKQLEYFISVAKHRNFTKAAEEFFISQPGLSHQIRALEQDLGCELFTRNTRSVILTPAGEMFLEDAKKILSGMESARQKLSFAGTQPAILRIAHLAAATQSFLPDVIFLFHEKYPHIKIRQMRMNAREVLESAMHRECDIYFSIMQDLASNQDLTVKKIQTDSFCLVTRRDHPAISTIPPDYSKIASEPFLVFQPESARYLNDRVVGLCEKIGFRPQIAESFDLYENLLTAIAAGNGISILPYRSRLYMNLNLVFTLLDIDNDTLDMGIAWHTEITNPAVSLFLDEFRRFMLEHPEVF